MKKFVMYFYNLKHEMYAKIEMKHNPKTDREGVEHFCGFYVRSEIISVEEPPKYTLYTPGNNTHTEKTQKKREPYDEELLF